jgi:hypothetical protein
VLCTTLSCSSSVTLTATLVRVRERSSARVEPHGSAHRAFWRLLRGALRTTPSMSATAGIARSASHAAVCHAAVVRRPAVLPRTDRWMC